MNGLRQNETSSGVRDKLTAIKNFIDIKVTGDKAKVIEEARNIFNSYYDHEIRDLLFLFPADHMTEGGAKFWSGPKRCPSAEPFSPADDLHVDFVWTCANLIFANIGMASVDREEVRAIVAGLPAQAYVKKTI